MSIDKNAHLPGKFLLAMPGMGDPRFNRAVILLCAHDRNGAMGLVINNILPGINLESLLKQLNITVLENQRAATAGIAVMNGGPVDNVRGFIIHTPDFSCHDTVLVNDQISVTGTVDALRAVAAGTGPKKMLFALGYAGWTAGQLDQELQDNTWLVFDALPDVIFEVEADQKWDVIIRRMGIDPAMISHAAGRA